MEKPARRKLNIGIVCHPAYGGSGVVASELGLELAARGHQVHFFSHSLPFRVPNAHPNTFFHEVEVTGGRASAGVLLGEFEATLSI